MPSSDAVEACVIFKALPLVCEIIHTHDSRRFTRNKHADFLPRVKPSHYGEVELGDYIVQTYNKYLSHAIVIQEHGEVFLGKNGISALNVIYSSINKLNQKELNDTNGTIEY